MNVTQIILGAFVILAGLNSRLQWGWMCRRGKFRIGENGEPLHYERLTRISWAVVALGVIGVVTGVLT